MLQFNISLSVKENLKVQFQTIQSPKNNRMERQKDSYFICQIYSIYL